MPNTYRRLLADAIERNNGYSSGYHDRYSLSFGVGLCYTDTSKENIFKRVQKEAPHLQLPPGFEWDEQQQWSWAQEDMARNLNDDDGNRTYGPETAKRFGLPFETFPRKCGYRDGVWGHIERFQTDHFAVEFGLAGRGGKHLVVLSFEGHELTQRSGDLANAIREDDDGSFSNKWCQRLLAMLTEWEQMFTSKNASDELEYQCAFRMEQELQEIHDEAEQTEQQQELQLAKCD